MSIYKKRTSITSWIMNSLLGLVLSLLSGHAMAFKLGTHIWVAEQVWNDVNADGSVNIPPFGEIPVSTDIVNAMRAHKSVYLSGSIGPDGFPDMIGGQMTTHPGTQGGWNTDDWARWLMQNIPTNSGTERNQAIAFTYGYFSHISADTFAHSYVNTYAGDTYELFDDETTVEARHMMVEAYIDKFTPITNPHAKIAIRDNLPLDWITRTVIMNPTVEGQYSINDSNGKSTLHLYLMHDYEDKIDDLISLVELMQDPLDAAIYAIAENVDQYLPPELLNPAQAALVAGNSLCEEVINNGDNEGLNINPIDLIAPIVSIANGGSNNNPVLNRANEIGEILAGRVEDAVKAAIDAVGEDAAACLMHTACISNYALSEAIKRSSDYVKCLATNPNACIHVWFAEKYCEVSAEVVEKHEELVRQYTYGAAILLMNDPYLGAIIHYLQEWKKSIFPAARSWTSLSSEIVSGILQHQSPVDKVVEWLGCWGLVYAGATTQIQSACETANSILAEAVRIYGDVQEAKSKLDYATLNLVGINAQQITEEIEQKISELQDKARDFVIDQIVPDELQSVLELTLNGITADMLNQEFAIDNTKFQLNRKYLVEVPRMSHRMEKEMNLIQTGTGQTFDPNKFAPAYNAVILSKLSLLNASQLNELARRAGMNKDLYTPGLSDHVLINAIRSIDGNHQWLVKAPPYPRQASKPDPEGDQHSYGYALSNSHGFRIYQDNEARSKLFNRIFIGMLAAGIEKPSVINEADVLPNSYPYRPCYSIPYPNGVNDKSCVIEYMIPVLNLLLSKSYFSEFKFYKYEQS